MIAIGSAVFVAGCSSGAIGKQETDAAFPKQDAAALENNPEYKAMKERDAQYEAQGRGAETQRGQPGAPEGPAPR